MTQDNMTQELEAAINTAFTTIFHVYGTDCTTWGEKTLGRYFGTCDLADLLGLDSSNLYKEALSKYKEAEAKSTGNEVPLAIVGQGEYAQVIKGDT